MIRPGGTTQTAPNVPSDPCAIRFSDSKRVWVTDYQTPSRFDDPLWTTFTGADFGIQPNEINDMVAAGDDMWATA